MLAGGLSFLLKRAKTFFMALCLKIMSRCARNTEEYVKQTWHLMYLKMRGEGTATEQDESWEKKKKHRLHKDGKSENGF